MMGSLALAGSWMSASRFGWSSPPKPASFDTTSPIRWRSSGVLGSYRCCALWGRPGAGSTRRGKRSPRPRSLPPFGTLLIGPAPLVPGIENGVYPAPGGIQEVRAAVPDLAIFAGATLYFQSIAVLSLIPLDVQLVNSTSTFFQ